MPTYSSFKYFQKLFGDFAPFRTTSTLFAQVLDYNNVALRVEAPDRVGDAYILVRTNNGAAQDPSNGRTVSSGIFTSRITDFEDSLESFAEGVSFFDRSPVGTSAYYTLFIITDDQTWLKDAATSVVIPRDNQTARLLTEMFPTVLLSNDSDVLYPPDVLDSDLYKFLYGMGLTYDELSTMIDFVLPENRDLQVTRRLHPMLSTGIGMPDEFTLGVATNARLHRNAGYIYRNKGRLDSVAAYVESLTGWNSVAIESKNKFLTLDDASFEESTGHWSFDDTEMNLERVEINDMGVFGPTMPYETEAYPFSKKAVGKVTLLQSGATRMSLPGSLDRLLCIPIRGGKAHYLSVPVRSATGSALVTPSVEWLSQTGQSLGPGSIGNVESGEDWEFAEGTILAPDDAYFAVVHLDIQGDEGDEVYLDCMSLTEGVVFRRTNLVVNGDVSEEFGFGLLDESNRSLEYTDERSWIAGKSIKVQNTSSSPQVLGVTTTDTILALSGQTYTGSVLVNPTFNTRVRLSFDWRDDEGSVSVSQSEYQTTLQNRWTRVFYTVTAPSDVNMLRFQVETEDAFADTQALFLDGFLVEQSPNLGDFFVGTTANTYGANQYGQFIYSNPEFGFVYRDPRSVTVICQPDRINLLFDPTFSLPNLTEIGEPGTAYGDDEYGEFTYGEPGDLATPWRAVNGSFETTDERFQTGSRSGKASGDTWDVYGLRVPVVGTFPYSVAATARQGEVLTDRFNLAGNPSFEVNATGWQNFAGNATGFPQRSTAESLFGVASLIIKRTTGAGTLSIRTSNAESPAAVQGQTFTVSTYIKPLTAQRNCRIQILARDSAFGAVTTFNGPQTSVPVGVWTRISHTATMTSADTAFIYVVVQALNSDADDEFAIDGVLVERTSELRPYFDGNTYDGTGGATVTTTWDGTANNSTSTATVATLDAQATCQLDVYWYDYSDFYLGAGSLIFEDLSEDWVRSQTAVIAPPTASYGIVAFRGTGTVYIDNAMMERADRPLTFFSGDVSNVDGTDSRWSNPGPRAYALLYNNAPKKLGRLKQTLPYYLPHGMVGRVLLWDSLDPEVQVLVPRGIYDEG
jgi:hypothetical protein